MHPPRQLSLTLPGLLLAILLPGGFELRAFEAKGTLQQVDVAKGEIRLHANGQDRVVHLRPGAPVLDSEGKALAEGLASTRLIEGIGVVVQVEKGARGPEVVELRLASGRGVGPVSKEGHLSMGLLPLDEMPADSHYRGEDGGLYGGGNNQPPPAHLAAAKRETAKILPLDAHGRPAPDGRIGLVSISMSNATQEFSLFKQVADADPRKSPRVAIVDCAQGGQAMAEWVDPSARPWLEADRRLREAGVGSNQVQVVWVKLANKMPRGDLEEHGAKLRDDTLAVLRNARARFPNLRIAYLGSRIYGGYATSALNPEPYAYESAFVARGLILDQFREDSASPAGTGSIPLLLWGPYFWADGVTPRKSDGLVWTRADLAGDGTHPSESGRRKVADLLLKFFTGDPLAGSWFNKP